MGYFSRNLQLFLEKSIWTMMVNEGCQVFLRSSTNKLSENVYIKATCDYLIGN